MEDGEIPRLLGFWPPGAGKSIYTSVVFPTHFLGRNKNTSIIVSSYGSDLPRKFGRKARSIIKQPIYKRIFGCELSPDSQAVDEWALTNGSDWLAQGILSGITGNRADGVIWDDLIKGREQADSKVVRDKTWDAYMDDLMTRKKPKAFEIGIMCMAGDTQVGMADGTRKSLCDIKVGDRVLSYLDGKIVLSRVLNWANKGLDRVFTIKTKSGRNVTANARHPFLIEVNGRVEWVRLKDIRVGHRVLKVTGGNGGELSAKNVTNQPKYVGSVMNTTANGGGKRESDLLRVTPFPIEMAVYDTVMGLISKIMRLCLKLKMGFVQSARPLQELITPKLGVGTFVLTTAIPLERFVDYFVTTATTLSENGLRSRFCLPPLSMYEITPDEVVAIEAAGSEDVFDIQVEHTENFIANGLVSHNTRWHEDDPAGRILPVKYNGETGWVEGIDGNLWYVVCLPAICEREDDPLGRKVGDRLWPEWFTEKHFEPYKRNARTWSALFQQRPAPESGDYFQSEWLKPYGEGTRVPAPHRDTLHVYGASDYATTDDGGNYTVHIVAGIDPNHNVFLLDLWRARTSSDKWVETFCDLVQKWRPLGWAEETGQIRAGVGPFLHKRLMERQLFIARAQFPTRGDKQVRAQSIRGRAAMGCLYVPTAASWYPDFRSELLAFPAGKTDDQVDCLGLIGQILDKMVHGSPKSTDTVKQKILSTDPSLCTVTLDDVFEENEKNNPKGKRLRIV